MQLQPVQHSEYRELISWITDAEQNYLWSGPLYSWPITVSQIESQNQKAEVHSFWFTQSEEKIGFIELNQISKNECRLCRVIINPLAGRGKGYGKQMIQLAISHACNELGARLISLDVFEHNLLAKRCYEAVGFELTRRQTGIRKFAGKDWPLLRMELR
ncbi:GNAT family N-acetyltransferase [Dongshaea marina]|uniref:GNAT family N-acetyltransferase n=1 Tax=Dongshaea marina TaxID=2047966 RepID=UPI000D3E6BB8|nr:GNAT family protein [Dongshaea marina]